MFSTEDDSRFLSWGYGAVSPPDTEYVYLFGTSRKPSGRPCMVAFYAARAKNAEAAAELDFELWNGENWVKSSDVQHTRIGGERPEDDTRLGLKAVCWAPLSSVAVGNL